MRYGEIGYGESAFAETAPAATAPLTEGTLDGLIVVHADFTGFFGAPVTADMVLTQLVAQDLIHATGALRGTQLVAQDLIQLQPPGSVVTQIVAQDLILTASGRRRHPQPRLVLLS